MTEEQKPTPNIAAMNVSDPEIKTVYANNNFFELGDTEVGLVFGYDFYDNGQKVSKPSVRVILSHDNFMRMMEFWEKRAKFLRRVYANRTPNTYSGDPREYRAALDELFPQQQAPTEVTSNDSSSGDAPAK